MQSAADVMRLLTTSAQIGSTSVPSKVIISLFAQLFAEMGLPAAKVSGSL
jgi:hypothetical protein